MAKFTQMLILMVALASVYAQKKGSDGYTDEERPYEFGFNIEGYQHRHEKKDENGIIMGEFGFITADGIYHVTVYATDENGDFKILKMKNIKVGFPPGSALKPTTPNGPVTSRPAAVSTTPATIRTSVVTTASTTPRLILNNGCGSCKVPVPTTKKPVPPPLPSTSFGSPSPPGFSPGSPLKPSPPGGAFGSHPGTGSPSPPGSTLGSPSPPGSTFGKPSPPGNTFGSPSPPGTTFGSPSPPGSAFGKPSPPGNTFGSPSPPGTTFGSPSPPGSTFGKPSPPGNTFGSPSPPGNTFGSPSPPGNTFGSPSPPGNTFGSPSPPGNTFGSPSPPGSTFGSPSPPGSTFGSPSPPGNTFGSPSPPGNTFGVPSPNGGVSAAPPSPTSGFGSSQPPKDNTTPHLTPIGAEKPGLPSGITEGDVKDLLYKFNYTVGFHGHNEEGYRNGDKNGAYFTNFRNGISERVKYVANEFGYQPNITFVPIGLESPDTPKEETEKDYGLKGYAFKWYYTR